MSTALVFQSTTFDVIDRNGQPWVRAGQVAEALGYKNARSIINIYQRNSEEFSSSMTEVIKSVTSGNLTTETRIFSLRGCHLLAMFARTPVAKAFRVWVLDVLETLNKAKREAPALPDSPLTPDQQCTLQNMVKGLVDKGGIYAQIWSRFNNHFRLGSYKQLPQSRMSEAVSYLMAFEVTPKTLPAPEQKALPAAPAPSVDEARRYWNEALDMNARMCDVANHVLNCCDMMLQRSREVLTHTREMIKHAPR